MSENLRPELGMFSNIICFRAVVTGTEDALGKRAALVTLKAAGRKRGHRLVASLGLTGQVPESMDTLTTALNDALGPKGTKLCIINKVSRDGDIIRVDTSETICSAGEPEGSDRECSFTQGAIHGAIEAIFSTKYRCKQVESVLRGGSYDSFQLTPR